MIFPFLHLLLPSLPFPSPSLHPSPLLLPSPPSLPPLLPSPPPLSSFPPSPPPFPSLSPQDITFLMPEFYNHIGYVDDRGMPLPPLDEECDMISFQTVAERSFSPDSAFDYIKSMHILHVHVCVWVNPSNVTDIINRT